MGVGLVFVFFFVFPFVWCNFSWARVLFGKTNCLKGVNEQKQMNSLRRSTMKMMLMTIADNDDCGMYGMAGSLSFFTPIMRCNCN